jgi:hypothetical protein
MDVKTRGYASTEFLLQVVAFICIIGITVAKNAWGWEIPSELMTLLWGLLGSSAVYTAGRSYYKGAKVKAMNGGAAPEPPVKKK